MDIVSLLELLVKGLFQAEEKFFMNPKDFYSLETSVKSTTDSVAAGFLSMMMDSLNKQIYDDHWRRGKYNVQRNDRRTLITSVGDITFTNTYYESCQRKGEYHYLTEEVVGLNRHERFSEAAEVKLLTEAVKTSYAEAAMVLPSRTKITKTTVMNKVHRIAEEMPYQTSDKKKQCSHLFIEADEDHVAEQHGRGKKKEENGNFISRLAYVYEYKQEVPGCPGRRELVNTFYFGGLYAGSQGIERFWKQIERYIQDTYEEESLKRIYISGDGAQWIKSGCRQIEKSVFCADRFHLMKYINSAANQMLDEADAVKEELYHLLHKKDKEGFREYTKRMTESATNTKPIEDLRVFVIGNWSAVMRAFHNKQLNGCSAESHVSHVLSDRLSSRPMGWSQRGADRMSKLRCYEKNYGREKIIDLVRYSREQWKLKRTGTEDVEAGKINMKQIMQDHYSQAKSYIERMQATIPGNTVKKMASIRCQIGTL